MTALVSEGLVNCMNLSLSLFPSSMFAVIIVIACLVRSDSFWFLVLVMKSKNIMWQSWPPWPAGPPHSRPS